MIILLDNIRSNHNVGSIFRTADAVGASGIILCGITPGPKDKWGRVNSALTKVALSATESISWKHEENTENTVDKLIGEGYTIYALEQASTAKSLFSLQAQITTQWEKLVLIVGNEVSGMSSSVLQKAHYIIEIPMFGAKESLNVAVAFGIVGYWLRSIYNNQ